MEIFAVEFAVPFDENLRKIRVKRCEQRSLKLATTSVFEFRL